MFDVYAPKWTIFKQPASREISGDKVLLSYQNDRKKTDNKVLTTVGK